MPYIKGSQREQLIPELKALVFKIQGLDEKEQDGALNYSITLLLKGIYPKRYRFLSRALGVLEAVKQEYYRVVVGPYEEEKRKLEGDV